MTSTSIGTICSFNPPAIPFVPDAGMLRVNLPMSSTLQQVTDFLGTGTPVYLSTAKMNIGISTGTSVMNFAPGTTAVEGITFGDTGSTANLYRTAANTLKSDGSLIANLIIGSSLGKVTMAIGGDSAYDTYYGGATTLLTRLANGTTGQVLTATTASAPSWTTLTLPTNGSYAPTITNSTNTDSTVTATTWYYTRTGNMVTVNGRFTADPTLTATSTLFEFSLPIASNLTAREQCTGTAACGTIVGMSAEVQGVSANDTGQVKWISSDINSQTWSVFFQYLIQ